MAFVDLHVHSKFSNHPSEWFLQKIGTRESYTETDFIYKSAKEQGMDYVTITDHNTIAGAIELHGKYPQDTFISVESTTYFPEDGCKIHILIYDITQAQFDQIEAVRDNIYRLRDYLKEQNLAHSVAHATYSINERLTVEHLEKLILLFDVFEGINGARLGCSNTSWREILTNFTPYHIGELYRKYGITPFSQTPWIKGFTGGSDDHAGLFIGKTFTTAPCENKKAFIDMLREKKTMSAGQAGNYKAFVFKIYKIAYDFSKNKASDNRQDVWGFINSVLFENKQFGGFKNWIAIEKMKKRKGAQNKILIRFIETFRANFSDQTAMTIDKKIDSMYGNVAQLADDLFVLMISSILRDFGDGKIVELIKNISAILPMAFLSAPFISSLKHLRRDKKVITELQEKYVPHLKEQKRVLWFTDTIDDLNGVAVTLKNFMNIAAEHDLNIKFVVCRPNNAMTTFEAKRCLNLPLVYEYTPDFYDIYTLRFPSFLRALEMLYELDPTEVIISTPGPVGLAGLIFSKLFGIKVTGVYHTDFSMQAYSIIKDESVTRIVDKGIFWIYSQMDEIRVPSQAYISILEQRGFERNKIKIFKRGFDNDFFKERPVVSKDILKTKYQTKEGFNLLWAGRVSSDKNLDFLLAIYEKIAEQYSDINLIIVGDGPMLPEIREKAKKDKRLILTGKVGREELRELYYHSDLFVFPSVTDTFGMVILEAQACGLPAIVTDKGGPQEIVQHEKTGYVLPATEADLWIRTIMDMYEKKSCDPAQYQAWRDEIINSLGTRYSWNKALEDILDVKNATDQPSAGVRSGTKKDNEAYRTNSFLYPENFSLPEAL
jgi:glycosyltransferase involved in cell wall biosynthesis